MVFTAVLLLHVHLTLCFFYNMVVMSTPVCNTIRQVTLSVIHILQFQNPMKQNLEPIWDQRQHTQVSCFRSQEQSPFAVMMWIRYKRSKHHVQLPPSLGTCWVQQWPELRCGFKTNLSQQKAWVFPPARPTAPQAGQPLCSLSCSAPGFSRLSLVLCRAPASVLTCDSHHGHARCLNACAEELR